jgi:hypothetical protein
VPVAKVCDFQAVFGGEDGRAGGPEDVVHRGGPELLERLEPADRAPEVELAEPLAGRAPGREGRIEYLGGGQDPVFVQ